jgi:type 1 fimbria pilin
LAVGQTTGTLTSHKFQSGKNSRTLSRQQFNINSSNCITGFQHFRLSVHTNDANDVFRSEQQ